MFLQKYKKYDIIKPFIFSRSVFHLSSLLRIITLVLFFVLLHLQKYDYVEKKYLIEQFNHLHTVIGL